MSTKSTSMLLLSSSAHLVMVSGKQPSSWKKNMWSCVLVCQCSHTPVLHPSPHPNVRNAFQESEWSSILHITGRTKNTEWDFLRKGVCARQHRQPRRQECRSEQSYGTHNLCIYWETRQTGAQTCTPKRSSLSCLFRRAHSDDWPCRRLVHMAISPQVMSAPNRLQTRRKGRFPHCKGTWVRTDVYLIGTHDKVCIHISTSKKNIWITRLKIRGENW